VLNVGPTAQLIARQILAPEPPVVPWPLRRAASVLAAGILPAVFRDAYGLPWRCRERVMVAVVRRAARAVVPVLSARVRYWPHYRVARQRMSL